VSVTPGNTKKEGGVCKKYYNWDLAYSLWSDPPPITTKHAGEEYVSGSSQWIGILPSSTFTDDSFPREKVSL